MLPCSLSKVNIYLLFIIYCIIYFCILLFELNILYSEDSYYSALGKIFSNNEISEIIISDKESEWFNFAIVPIFVFLTSLITAVILNIFKFLFDISIKFNKLLHISIFGHFTYVIFYLLNVIVRFFLDFNLLEGEKNYFSLATYIDRDVPLIIRNLAKVFNLQVGFYIISLSYLIFCFEKINLKKSLLFVTTSIVVAYVFYILILSILNLLII